MAGRYTVVGVVGGMAGGGQEEEEAARDEAIGAARVWKWREGFHSRIWRQEDTRRRQDFRINGSHS